MIPVPVGQNQQPDLFAGERLVRALGRVEEDQSVFGRCRETVGGIGPAGKSFELHGFWRVEATNLIFLAQPGNQGDQL